MTTTITSPGRAPSPPPAARRPHALSLDGRFLAPILITGILLAGQLGRRVA